jgi:hypothetical protein
MEPKMMTGRVAVYHSAIKQARESGYTWAQIWELIGPTVGASTPQSVADAFRRANKAIESGRLRPAQLNFPSKKGILTKEPFREPTRDVDTDRPLPTIPGTIPDDEAERRKRLQARGVKFFE